MAIIKKTRDNKFDENEEKREPFCTIGGKVNWCSHYGKQNGDSKKKKKKLGPHRQHMEVPRPEVKLEMQLPPYTTATATPDQSHICDLHHTSQQHWILNPLRGARDGTHIFMDSSWTCYH